MTILSEDDLKERAKNWNLKLISNYKVYKNIHSNLQWKCLECGFNFYNSIFNINQSKFPCQKCGRIERELPFYDMTKKIKECGLCHQIIPLSSFDRSISKRREKGGL